MSSDDEILELGPDGSYEITSTLPIKQDIIKHEDIVYTSIHIDEDDDDDNVSSEKNILDNEEELTTMKSGHYKIYKDSHNIFIIVRLHENDSVIKVGYLNKEVHIHTKLDSKYNILLKDIASYDINVHSGSCSTYQDFVSIKYNLIQ